MSDSRVALVTGSGKRRVGWHVADALARRGYSIAVHYHHSAREADESIEHFKGHKVEAHAFQADLSDESAVIGLVSAVFATFGRIDVLVNCAAIWESKRLEEITASDVHRLFDTNLLSTFLCCQHVGLIMARQERGGSIVNIGDWATTRPYLHHAAYFLSKAGIPDITKMLAVEFASRNRNVRVNCLLPGPVMLPPTMSADERARVTNATLLKRVGRPENIAQAVIALIENDFITGAALPVDGGRSAYASDSEEVYD